MKVYIVTSGEYSDYHIDRVFSTRKKAQEFLDHIGKAGFNIEEYDVDEKTPRGVFSYQVIIPDYSGRKTRVSLQEPFTEYEKDAFRYTLDPYNEAYCFNIQAKDAPHAIKIASERLMQIRAMKYLFPRLYDECVRSVHRRAALNIPIMSTPWYNYRTKEIVLKEGEYII